MTVDQAVDRVPAPAHPIASGGGASPASARMTTHTPRSSDCVWSCACLGEDLRFDGSGGPGRERVVLDGARECLAMVLGSWVAAMAGDGSAG